MEQLTFSWIDYLVFSSLLGVSIIIGIYFGFFSKQDTVNEYLFAGKTMAYFPVTVSGIASYLSGITFLGYPTEVYFHGSLYFNTILATYIVIYVTNKIFLPVFFKLQMICVNEYLELRFSKAVRKLCSIIYMFGLLMYCAIIIYAPALAFSQLSGIDLHILTPILCVICIFYTSLGGVKAVIWTDTFQFMFAVGGLVSILIIGIKDVGGFGNIWRITSEGKRLIFFDMNPSIYERTTFWTIMSMMIFGSIGSFSISQKHIQKLLSIHEEKGARKAVWLIMIGIVIIKYLCIILGLTMYTKYHDCDPVKAKYVERTDQLLPYYVMDIAGTKKGLPGLFLAGLISSALATLSAALNTLGSVIYDDFLKAWLPDSYNEETKAANIIKIIVVVVGFSSIGLVFVAERMGTIFELSNSFLGAATGPLLGLYILGTMLPWVGNIGALVGGYVSLAIMSWIAWGTKWHVMNHRIRYEELPTSTIACANQMNETWIETTTFPPLKPEDEPLAIFQISILHYTALGTLITVVLGFITSYFAKEMNISNVNPDYVAPMMQRFLPKKVYTEVPLESTPNDQNKCSDENSYIEKNT